MHLWTSNQNARGLFPQDAKLYYLSPVHVPGIPLYLAAGPSLEVSSDNEATLGWLSEVLLAQEDSPYQDNILIEPWWSRLGGQSDHGMLLRVESGENGQSRDNTITEVLLYAAMETSVAALPAPPASSLPAPPDEHLLKSLPRSLPDVKVYALPLCSKIFDRAERAAGLLSPPPEECKTPREACFLPYGLSQPHDEKTASQKRQSLSSLFEDATQKRRKLKGRGGEIISKAMAGIDRPLSQHGLPQNVEREELETPPLPQKGHAGRRSLTRASTIMSVASSDYSRPASRSGPLANGKRSSLCRVESAISLRDSPTLSDTDGGFALQNKAALTKVVMAGMRLHGLQQRKKPGKRPTLDERPNSATSAGDSAPFSEAEDEYKLVYHQTFKAATFTFRRHFGAQIISQELMRDVVDKFLILFCSDPLTTTGLQDGGLAPFGTTNGESLGAFDKPTIVSSSPMPGRFWSPPTAKRGDRQ